MTSPAAPPPSPASAWAAASSAATPASASTPEPAVAAPGPVAGPDPVAAPPAIDLHDLRIELPGVHGPVTPVRGISLSLAAGDTLGIIGESGSGKSLTALALMGLLPDGAQVQGRLRIGGQDLTQAPDAAWRRLRGRHIAMVFQEPMTALNPLHPIGRQVAEPLRIHQGLTRRAARDRALALLERVGIPNAAQRLDAYPHQFSGGQRQRIVIAMALACNPEVLIADEPTTALDATVQRQILDLLAELVRERQMALILISHDLGVVAHTTRHVAVMYAGQFVETGPTREVFAQPRHPYTQGLFAARPSLAPRPDGAPPERLATIAGQVPDLPSLDAMRGCSFAPRCAHAAPVCAVAPPMQRVSAAHGVRCVRVADLSASVPPHD
ncbi:ABC transporter ATP-binding protein [Comamonas serinivorans]|uniref:ABC transporter ATP-binding protein n=1 Tax=Comamonas serinivorans TaxID=1082851 RepID=A0A1Y0EL01_9BURK|nr:ABC transporter ATP-binding protein [Comamonas serinivorans]ARU03992.1 ABC transporter ATP-binding protein [Comamonas serinivorans]